MFSMSGSESVAPFWSSSDPSISNSDNTNVSPDPEPDVVTVCAAKKVN